MTFQTHHPDFGLARPSGLRDLQGTIIASRADTPIVWDDLGYLEEACQWRDWLLRAVAGHPAGLQIMYGLSGERRLTELELPWLPGYESSSAVRIGNAASNQSQLDEFGEVIDALYQGRRAGLAPLEDGWRVERLLLKHLETAWTLPDEGNREVRGVRRPFTHSKVMAWVAFDRAVKSVEQFRVEGPVERWRAARDQIHEQVCRGGFNGSGADKVGMTADTFDPSNRSRSLPRHVLQDV